MAKFLRAFGKKTPYGVAFTRNEVDADYLAPVLIASWAHVVAQWTTAQIVALVVDIDNVTAEEAFSRVADADLMPSRIVRTPHGAHVWYNLDENIKIIRTNNLLNPVAAGSMMLWAWAQSLLVALTKVLGGDPASTSPCAYRRYPRKDAIHYESDTTWTLARLSQHRAIAGLLEGQNRQTDAASEDLRTVLRDLARYGDGVFARHYYTPEGGRNSVCWKLAICAVILSGGDLGKAWAYLRPWADSCGYSEAECQYCLQWARRSRVVQSAERRNWTLSNHRLDRSTQAAVAAAHASAQAEMRVETVLQQLLDEGRKITPTALRAATGARPEVIRRVLSRCNLVH